MDIRGFVGSRPGRDERSRPRRSFKSLVAVCVIAIAAAALTLNPGLASAATRVVNGIVVQGSILVEYNRLESIGKSPQRPASAEQNDRKGGKFQRFYTGGSTTVNNTIYWNSRVDPGRGRQVGGAIYSKWGQLDWENGFLGYPTTSEGDAVGGKFNFFEGGSLYWSSATGAHAVVGEILETWAANNYERGGFGFPTSDEENASNGGKRQRFQNGEYIEWQPGGFPGDWAGDTFQDNDANNNNDIYYPTCGPDCANDSNIASRGPQRFSFDQQNRRSSSTPSARRGQTEAVGDSQFCSDVKPDPTAPAGKTSLCILRDGEEAPAFEAPTSSTPSSSPSATTPPSSTTTPSDTPDRSTTTTQQEPPTTTTTTTTPPSEAPASQTPTTEDCTSASTTPSASPTPDCVSTTSRQSARESSAFAPSPAYQPATSFQPAALENSADYCNDGDKDGDWYGDRMYMCRSKLNTVIVNDKNTGKPIGSVLVREDRNLKLDWNNTTWTEELQFRIQNVLPNPLYGPEAAAKLAVVVVSYDYFCQYGDGILPCYDDGGSQATTPINAVINQSSDKIFRKGAPVQPNGTMPAQSTWRITATQPDDVVQGLTGYTPVIRCDAAAGMRSTQGCAVDAATPVMNYTDPQYGSLDQFVNHVRLAQESGLPGAIGKPVLTRISDKTVIDKNRAGTCGQVTGGLNNRQSGLDCDEYPFASSDQGGRVGGPFTVGGKVRSFVPPCQILDTDLKPEGDTTRGYSVCLIDSSQNRRAGSVLSWFYTKNRVIAGDAFHVKVTP